MIEPSAIDPKALKRSPPEPDDRYKLPKGVQWNDVGHDAKDWGLFIANDRIWTVHSSERIDEATGLMVNTYTCRYISNFSIEILQHMEDEKLPMYLVRIQNTDGRERIFDCRTDDFGSPQNFCNKVRGKGNYHFTGSKPDFERLMGYLMDHMGDGSMVTELGWQPEDKLWIFCNCAVDQQGRIIDFDEYGSFKVGRKHFYVPAGNKSYGSRVTRFQGARLVEHIDSGVDFKALAGQLLLVHREHSMVALTWAVATVFSDHIFRIEQGFPIYFAHGEPSTGKNQLILALQCLFGRPQPTIALTSKANTDKGKMRMFAEFFGIIIFLDEYRNSLPDEMFELLKGLWGRVGYRRGVIDSGYGTETVPIRCAAALAGNYYPNQDDALLTRLIVDHFDKDDFNEKEKAEYDVLTDMMEVGYSSALVEVVKHRAHFEKHWKNAYISARGDIETRMGMFLTSRTVKNYAIILATYRILEKKLAWPFTYAQLFERVCVCIKAQDEARDEGNDIAHFFECFVAGVKDRKLLKDVHFRVDHDVLTIIAKEVHLEYQRQHLALHHTAGHNWTTIRQKLEKHPSWIGPKDSMWVGDRRTSVYLFKMSQIDKDMVGLLVKSDQVYGEKDEVKELAERMAQASNGGQAVKKEEAII